MLAAMLGAISATERPTACQPVNDLRSVPRSSRDVAISPPTRFPRVSAPVNGSGRGGAPGEPGGSPQVAPDGEDAVDVGGDPVPGRLAVHTGHEELVVAGVLVPDGGD